MEGAQGAPPLLTTYKMDYTNDCMTESSEGQFSNSTSNELNEGNTDENFKSELTKIRSNNVNKLIFAHININSIRNKFNLMTDSVKDNIDILMISETKLYDSVPANQFIINGYNQPYRLDRRTNGGGILVYVCSDIPRMKISVPNLTLECLFIELNIRRKEMLLCCSYNPHKNSISFHLNEISKQIDVLYGKYDSLILMGDFNAEPSNQHMQDFMELYDLENLIKESTCFKNPQNPSCIDLILSNHPRSFQFSQVLETGLSDFHKMTLTVLKMFYQKPKPNIITYRDYKNFSNNEFRNECIDLLSNITYSDYDGFHELITTVKDKQIS